MTLMTGMAPVKTSTKGRQVTEDPDTEGELESHSGLVNVVSGENLIGIFMLNITRNVL